jgi:predicted nucleic acid-binding protein
MNYLLDSVILIDHFNNIEKATEWLRANIKNCYISVITRAEILVGFDKNTAIVAKKFLNSFKTIPINEAEADLADELRKENKWKLPDALQAAVAINHKLLLITRNSKDFSPKAHAFVSIPYVL